MIKWICLLLLLLPVSPVAYTEPYTRSNEQVLSDECFRAVGPLLRNAGGRLTPELRSAYLDWAEKTVLQQLSQQGQTVTPACVAEVHGDATLRDAVFGSVFPPDPSILQNYAELRSQLGAQVLAKYRSLAVATAVAKRVKGVEKPDELRSLGRDYQPGFWVDESLRTPGSDPEKDLVRRIAAFMKQEKVAATDLYQNVTLQERLKVALTAQNVPAPFISEVSRSVSFGERLKNAMIVLGQRPSARETRPSTVAWLRHLIALNEAAPSSTPTIDGKAMVWPQFPIHAAPWPLLMPLAHSVPLSEADYIWEAFQGKHGEDRYHTYGPYRGDEDVMAASLNASPWFWDAWPDRIVHGGMCVPISKGTVDLYSALGKPAMWAGQPGHANLISFQYQGNAWTAEVEQAFAGGPYVTFAQWYFDEEPGTQLRFRDLYYWAGAEYHLGLAVGMNAGLSSYMDTRLAANLFRALPPAEKKTLGVPLLKSTLKANPYNPEIWYRLAEQAPDVAQGMVLVDAARKGDPGLLVDTPGSLPPLRGGEGNARDQYWRTVTLSVAQYALLSRPAPQGEADRQRVLVFLASVPDVSANDLTDYTEKFLAAAPDKEALAYNKTLADQGDTFGLLRMGQRYRDGDGVTQNDTLARQCLTRAAAQGDMVAATLLGNLAPVVPSDWIAVTASSEYKSDQSVRHLVDGAGLVGGVHDNNTYAYTMWHTPENPGASTPASGLPASPAWVRFDFKQPIKIDSFLIWNENQSTLYNRGFRKTRIYGSTDEATWFPLTASGGVELPRANGKPFLTASAISNRLVDRPLKAVIIAAEAADGNYGGNCYGLSAVRFVLSHMTNALPARAVTVTASSEYKSDQTVRHLIDGSGMLGSLHDNNTYAYTMWHTPENPAPSAPAPGLPASPAWVRFDFLRPRQVAALLLWNHNQETLTDRGFRKMRIYGSLDGVTWHTLTTQETIELARASGGPLSEPVTIGNKDADQPLKSIIIAAEAVDGNYGGNCYGLSAVRFIVQPE